jgi:hypothetical protein
VAAGDPAQGRWRLVAAIAGSWVVFAVAVRSVRRAPRRAAVALILVGGLALQLVAMSSAPRLTNDFFRYAWDARVQAAGISPYRYTPVDPALAGLRTDWLFPADCAASSPPCTRLNHPTSPTIYPPVAQAEFLAVHLVTRPLGPDGGRDRTWQVLAALLATATTVALLLVLRRRSDPRQAVLWAWCPTVVIECGGNAHVDALAALLVVLALGLLATACSGAGRAGRARRLVGTGVLAGLAVATKLLPALVLPALAAPVPGVRSGWPAWRRWAVTRGLLLVAVATTVAVVYLPHVAAVGPRVLGFLPGYLPEEGYDGRSRFPLLRPWVPDAIVVAVALALLVVLAVAVARRTDPVRPWSGALVMTGATFAVLGITYPWYALLLVPLVALDGRGVWLAIAAAAYPAYLAPALGLPFTATSQVVYLAAAIAIVVAPATATVTAAVTAAVAGRGLRASAKARSRPSCCSGSCSCASPRPPGAGRTRG